MNYAAQKYLERGRFKNKEEAEDWVEAQFKEQEEEMIAAAEKIAGIANYGKYKVLTHVAKGEKVEIIIHWPANTHQPFPEGLKYQIFHSHTYIKEGIFTAVAQLTVQIVFCRNQYDKGRHLGPVVAAGKALPNLL